MYLFVEYQLSYQYLFYFTTTLQRSPEICEKICFGLFVNKSIQIQKGMIFWKSNCFQSICLFAHFRFLPERRNQHTTHLGRIGAVNLFTFPSLIVLAKNFSQRFGRPSAPPSEPLPLQCLPLAVAWCWLAHFIPQKKAPAAQYRLKVPIKSFPWRVSSSGISRTTMSTFFSFVNNRHCSKISE